ncbi:MAG: hypothetical protein HKN80_15575 [Acidimicrobiia bacterium]|nr:hypothetical protein [Acidimicrobiia bacterium]
MHDTTTAARPLGWFIISTAGALVVALAIASGVGGVTGLLAVGEDFPIRPYIENDFPDVHLAAGVGHDGQQYYGIARDPFGRGEVPNLLDNPSYRYLFILYPALAGGLGTFSPGVTVAAMLALSVIGFGLAGASALTLNHQLGGRTTIAHLAAANAGLFLAVRFLTPDPLALGLAMLGVTLAVGGKDRAAAAALGLAVLTKAPFVLFPLALGAWVWPIERRRAWWLTIVPAIPATLWVAYVFIRFGPSTSGNLAAPFVGLVRATAKWSEVSSGEMIMALFGAALLVAGAVLAIVSRDRLLRILLVTWVALGAISSDLIWVFGNNVLRVLAPLWAIAAVAAAVYFSSNRSRKNLPV